MSQMIAEAAKLDTQAMSLKDIVTVVAKIQPQLLLEVLPYFLG